MFYNANHQNIKQNEIFHNILKQVVRTRFRPGFCSVHPLIFAPLGGLDFPREIPPKVIHKTTSLFTTLLPMKPLKNKG